MTGEGRRSYTREYKYEAVRLITDEGHGMAEVARNLGINANILGRWKREAQEEDAFPGKGRMKPMEEELRRLRRENQQLKMDREILKKRRPSLPRSRSDVFIHQTAEEDLCSGQIVQVTEGEP
mgnify:CR=1 FL=1